MKPWKIVLCLFCILWINIIIIKLASGSSNVSQKACDFPLLWDLMSENTNWGFRVANWDAIELLSDMTSLTLKWKILFKQIHFLIIKKISSFKKIEEEEELFYYFMIFQQTKFRSVDRSTDNFFIFLQNAFIIFYLFLQKSIRQMYFLEIIWNRDFCGFIVWKSPV